MPRIFIREVQLDDVWVAVGFGQILMHGGLVVIEQEQIRGATLAWC